MSVQKIQESEEIKMMVAIFFMAAFAYVLFSAAYINAMIEYRKQEQQYNDLMFRFSRRQSMYDIYKRGGRR